MNPLLAFVILLPLISSFVLWLIRKNGDDIGDGLVCLTALVELMMTVALRFAGESYLSMNGILHSGLHFTASASGSHAAIAAALCFLLVVLSCPASSEVGHRLARLRCALMVGLSGVMGVFYAADFMTLYLFLMVLSLAACIWVAHPETPEAKKAADTCLATTMISGLTLLYGLFLLHHHFGTLAFGQMNAEGTVALLPAVCLLIGFLARAAAFPLHIWLPGAAAHGYSGAGALFTGALAAAGLHGILMEVTYLELPREMALVLLALGLVTLVFGGLCAAYATDLKRLLVFVAVAQVGMGLVVSAFYPIHMAVAKLSVLTVTLMLSTTALFVLDHVLEQEYGTSDLNSLKGAAQGNKLLTVLFLLPALSLVGFPGLAGHAVLAQVHEALTMSGIPAGVSDLAQAGLPILFLGCGLVAAALLKVFLKVFIQPRTGAVVKVGREAILAMAAPSVLLLVSGLLPELSFNALLGKFTLAFRFSGSALLAEAIVLAVGAVLWLVIVRYLRTDKETGDYVPSQPLFSLEDDVFGNLLKLLSFVGALFGRLCYSLTELVIRVCDKLLHLGAKDRWNPGKDPHFSHYSKGYVRMNPILTTLSFELLLFGLGVVAVFIYLLV